MRSTFYIAVVAALVAQVPLTEAAVAQNKWRITPPKQLRECTPKRFSNGCTYWLEVGKPWWPKQGAPMMEGQWRKECNDITGGRGQIAVFQFNPAWVQVNCYAMHTVTRG